MAFETNIPVYAQIADDIKQQIISGKLPEEEKLPSLRECCEKYKVTLMTMRRAIERLERENIVYSRNGVGTFVSDGVVPRLTAAELEKVVKAFVGTMRKMGYDDGDIVKSVKEGLENE